MSTPQPFTLPDTLELLARTPAAINALLRGLPQSWAHRDEGAGTWSPYEIIGHLIAGEHTDWMPRIRLILNSGEARPFDPFDRFAQSRVSQDKSLDHLLDDFTALRKQNLTDLDALHLQPADLERRGIHPALGTVTLSELLATWAVHDLTHLHQLTRVFARPLRDAVGPWSDYLGVLKCTGHSAP